MRTLCKLVFVSGVAMVAAGFPAMAQQQPAPIEDHGAHHGGADQQPGQQAPGGGGMMGGMMGQGGMMGPGGMMGQGGTGMMNQGTTGQGMMGGYPMMMGGYPMMMGPMMGGMMPMMGGMMPMMGGMMPMMGGMMPMMMGGYPMGGTMGPMMMGSNMMGTGTMGWGGGTPQTVPATLNLSTNDVTAYLQRWIAMSGNPHIKVGSVTEKDANTITADIVTTDKDALVQRLNVDRHTGYYTPVQ